MKELEKNNFVFDDKEHAYFLNDKPMLGVTSVINATLPKPALIQWAANMAVQYLVNVIKPYYGESNQEPLTALEDHYIVTGGQLEEAKSAHRKKKEKAGVAGTGIHAEVEKYIKLMIDDQDGIAHGINDTSEITPFIDWAVENKVKFLKSEYRVYSEEHWFAGTMDFLYEMDGGTYIGDLKTSKAIYPEMFIQMGAYQIALEEREKGIEIKGRTIVRLNGKLEVKTSYDDQRDKGLFLNCLAIYKALQTFNQ